MQVNLSTNDERDILIIEHVDGSLKQATVVNIDNVLDYIDNLITGAEFLNLDVKSHLRKVASDG